MKKTETPPEISPTKIPNLVFVTALNGAGKSALVHYLKTNLGFEKKSARKFIDASTKAGELKNRPMLGNQADHLRDTFGSDYIIRSLAEATRFKVDAVIESVRTMGEVAYIQRLQVETKGILNVLLVSVEADIYIRYERIRKRASITDNVSFAVFQEEEAAESCGNNPSRMNIPQCCLQADITIINNGALDVLNREIKTKLIPHLSLGSAF